MTQNSAGEITDNLVKSKKKTTEPGMTFSQTKKPTRSVSMNKFNCPFIFYQKNYKKSSLESKYNNRTQTALSGTEHSVTTNKNEIKRRKHVPNPLPIQQTISTPTKRINSRRTYVEQPTGCKRMTSRVTTKANSRSQTKVRRRKST